MSDQEKHILSEVLERLRGALALLDESSASAHIGAYVDMAIHELYSVIALQTAGSTFDQPVQATELH